MTSRLATLLFTAALAATVSACADQPSTDILEEEIIGGFPARSKKLDAIGALGIAAGDGTYYPFCTGTLITPTVVLTAEHCVNWIGDASQVAFLVGWNAAEPKAIHPAKGFAWEETVAGGLVGLGSDVAVMHLAAPITDVTPLPYAALDGADVGRRYVGVGYGQQDAIGSAGTRLAGSMTFNAIGGNLYAHIYGSFDAFVEQGRGVFFPADLDTSVPENLALLQQYYDDSVLLDGIEGFFGNGDGDAQACFGDSGGPITRQLGGKTTVFGVASWVPFADALCQYGTTYAALEPIALDFLDYELHCPLVPRAGTCDGLDVAVRCATADEGGYRELRTDCSELGLVCAVDEYGEIGCTDDPCEDLPAEGVCDGTVATRCSTPEEGPRQVISVDCAATGDTCGFEGGVATCVDDGLPDCTHDVCEVGAPLDAECGDCQTAVCAADPYCCEVAWDSLCVSQVEAACGTACPGAPEPTPEDVAARQR